jgi:hypothetical protein
MLGEARKGPPGRTQLFFLPSFRSVVWKFCFLVVPALVVVWSVPVNGRSGVFMKLLFILIILLLLSRTLRRIFLGMVLLFLIIFTLSLSGCALVTVKCGTSDVVNMGRISGDPISTSSCSE